MDTQRPVCAQEAMKLLNCVAGPEFDQEKCLGLLHSLRECVLNKAEKRDAVGMQEKALNFEVSQSQVQRFWPHFGVPKFTQDLCTLEVPPMDSQTLTEALHAHGINIRYIGKIAEGTKHLPHLWELCTSEIAVRGSFEGDRGPLYWTSYCTLLELFLRKLSSYCYKDWQWKVFKGKRKVEKWNFYTKDINGHDFRYVM